MKLIIAGCLVFVASSVAIAQDSSLVGKYSGDFQGGRSVTGIVLNIKSIEDGVVKGTVERFTSGRGMHGTGAACTGEFPVEGTYKGNALQVRSVEKGGRADDCGVNLRMQVEGNKLVGTFGKNNLTLSK